MSDMVEIEVGANLGKFHQSMAQVRSSIRGVRGGIEGVNFNKANESLTRLGEASKKSGKDARTFAGLLQQLGQTKISAGSIRDLKEVFKEVLRIVSELGAIITLAFNALDKPLQNAVAKFTKFATQVERANSNFLVLRKIPVVRFLTEVAVNTQRAQTSIEGMASDFLRFGKNTVGALQRVGNGMKRLGSHIKEAEGTAVGFQSVMSSDSLQTFVKGMDRMADAVKRGKEKITEANGVSGKMQVAFGVLSEVLQNARKGAMSMASGIATTGSSATKTTGSLDTFLKSLNRVKIGGVAGKIAITGMTGGLMILARAASVAGRALMSIGVRVVTSSMRLLQRTASSAVKPVKDVAVAIAKVPVNPIKAATKGFGLLGRTIGIAKGVISGILGTITSLGNLLTKIATSSVVKFRKAWVATFSQMPNVSATTANQIQADMRRLQESMGIVSEQAVPALEKSLQKGFTGTDAVQFLQVAATVAKSGVIDLGGAVDVVGDSMRAFSNEGIKATDAADKLFTASRQGGIAFEELNGSVKRMAPAIADAGVSFDDFLASLAVLTKQGRVTTAAMGDISRLAKALVQPSGESAKAFEELGISFSKADLSGRGLGSILQEVAQKTNGNQQAMALLLGGVENLDTALKLGGQNGAKLQKNLDGLGDSAGIVVKQAGKMENSLEKALNVLQTKLEFLRVDLSKMLDPAKKAITEWLTEWTDKLSQAFKVAQQLFSSGDLGQVFLDSIIIGIDKAFVAMVNFSIRVSRGLSEALIQSIGVMPDAFKGAVANILARLSKIGAFFIGLGGKIVMALQKPIAFLQAGLIKAIEEAEEALNKLPFIGDGEAKARKFDVILKQKLEEGAAGKLGQNIIDQSNNLDTRADAIIAKTQEDFKKTLEGLKKGFTEGFSDTEGLINISDSTKQREIRRNKMLEEASKKVEESMAKAKQAAKDVILNNKREANNTDGDGNNNLLGGGGKVIASSMAAIGGGGGVFGVQEQKLQNLIDVNKEQRDLQRETLKLNRVGGETLFAQ